MRTNGPSYVCCSCGRCCLPSDAAGWVALTDQQREEVTERHQDNERSVQSQLLLCNEAIHMVMCVTQAN